MNRVGDTLIHFAANQSLIEAMLAEDVSFVVVGGLAMAWHCPERQADDMDLLVAPTQENSARVTRALSRLGLRVPNDEAFARPGVQAPFKQVHYAELLTPEADGMPYAEVRETAVDAKLFGYPVKVASIATLLHMKKRAAKAEPLRREKHEKDITLLERANAA